MKFRPFLKASLSVALLIQLSFGGTSIAGAATGLTIQPVKFSYVIEQGQSVDSIITLSNASDADVFVEAKVEDFIPLAGSDGVQFISRAEGVTSVRDWVTLPESSFELKQGQTKLIKYKIVAPPDAEPGSHFGVVFFKAIKASDMAQQLKIGTQVGVLLFVSVPGDVVQSGKLLNFTAPLLAQESPIRFKLTFENTGTVHFEPRGEIAVKNLFGKVVGTVPVEGKVVLPTGTKEIPVDWNTHGTLFGRYSASVVLKDVAGKEIATAEKSFYAFPLTTIGAFAGALILVYLILYFVRKKLSISISVKK